MKNNILSCIFFVALWNASIERPAGHSVSVSLKRAFWSQSTIFYHRYNGKLCLFFNKVTCLFMKQPKVTTVNLFKTILRTSLNTHRRADDKTRGFVLPV